MASDHPSTGPLPGLPGAGLSGSGPVVEPLLDELLSDTLPQTSLIEHREHKLAWYGDLVGPLRVLASATEALIGALLASDHGLPIILIPDLDSADQLGDLRVARSLLFDNHRIELVGMELPFAAADSVADAARQALDQLDFTVPAWFRVSAVPGWEPAFDVLAQDGAESVALELPAPRSMDVFSQVAGVLRALIDRELPYAVTGGIGGLVSTSDGHGLLNLLCATRAALNGAETAELTMILAEPSPDPLASAARRMSEADAAIVRAFLPRVSCPSIHDLVGALRDEGLIEPDAA
jgi:hypothetical protein